jgi:hypothetical protein
MRLESQGLRMAHEEHEPIVHREITISILNPMSFVPLLRASCSVTRYR